MADPRFFSNQGPFTLARLAELGGAELVHGADPEHSIDDLAPLGNAGPRDLSFLDNTAYKRAFQSSGAGAAVVRPEFRALAPDGMALLLSAHPWFPPAVLHPALVWMPIASPVSSSRTAEPEFPPVVSAEYLMTVPEKLS